MDSSNDLAIINDKAQTTLRECDKRKLVAERFGGSFNACSPKFSFSLTSPSPAHTPRSKQQ